MTIKKLKSFKHDTIPANQMILRMVTMRAETINDESKSVEVVIASETPVERWDESRGDVFHEILSMDGVQFRNEKRQLPIVDSHDRSTVRNVLGSVRNLRIEGNELVGDAMFAADADSQNAFRKLRDGHLTDFSITAQPNESQSIRRGEVGIFRGAEVNGPATIVSRWTPSDASLVAAGADVNSTVRELFRAYQDVSKRITRMMTDDQKAKLVAMGMPADVVDLQAALDWLINKDAPAAEPIAMAEEVPAVVPAEEPIMSADTPVGTEEMKLAIGRALQDDAARRREIVALCSRANIERSFADELCNKNISLPIAREKVLELMINKPLGTSVAGERISVTASSEDKTTDAIRSGLIQRAMRSANVRTPAFTASEPAAEGYKDFANMDLFRIAETILQRGGINTSRMNRKDIAMVAMGHYGTINRMQIQRDAAWHTTGTFSNLMLDAASKTLRAGYEEAIYTHSIWSRQGASAPDLKALNRVMFSEFPNMEMVPENQKYPESRATDAKESYKVSKFGTSFTISWEAIVNDDLDAFGRIPAMQGAAARRTQNAKVYEVLTANALMSDGKALFATDHASGSNLQTTGAAPSETTLNAGYLAMALQKGLNATVALNITPRFLIVPRALEATALKLVQSTTPPTDGGSAVGTSGSSNLYGPGGGRQLTVVSDAVLDANSAIIWYLAASPSEVDTVELTFLQGEESPVLENEWDMTNDTWFYKIRQTFGVKAIDWRGLYENDGS